MDVNFLYGTSELPSEIKDGSIYFQVNTGSLPNRIYVDYGGARNIFGLRDTEYIENLGVSLINNQINFSTYQDENENFPFIWGEGLKIKGQENNFVKNTIQECFFQYLTGETTVNDSLIKIRANQHSLILENTTYESDQNTYLFPKSIYVYTTNNTYSTGVAALDIYFSNRHSENQYYSIIDYKRAEESFKSLGFTPANLDITKLIEKNSFITYDILTNYNHNMNGNITYSGDYKNYKVSIGIEKTTDNLPLLVFAYSDPSNEQYEESKYFLELAPDIRNGISFTYLTPENNRILTQINIATPIEDNHAATKKYVDDAIDGSWSESY